MRRRLTESERRILVEAARIKRRLNEMADLSKTEAAAKQAAILALRTLSEDTYAEAESDHSLEYELTEMLEDDALTYGLAADLIEAGRFAAAYQELMSLETGARDEVPEGVWSFLDRVR
jgi:hypothetical protein